MGSEGEAKVSSVDVRGKLERLLERDLLGPWGEHDEELEAGTTPAERYLLGRLVPRDTPIVPPASAGQLADDEDPLRFSDDPDLAEQAGLGEDGDGDTDSTAAVRSGSMAASALGLSFTVPDDIDAVLVEAKWGWYRRVKSETQVTEQGNPRTVWKRHPAGGTVEIPLGKEAKDYLVPDGRQDGVVVRYTVRHRDRTRIVDVMLVNEQAPPQRTADEARLYQAGMTVTAFDGHAAVFVGHNDPELSAPPPQYEDPELLYLKMLYREHRQYAHGRQCAVDAEVRAGELRAWRLSTTSFPEAEVPLVEAVTAAAMPGVELDMTQLGSTELARNDLIRKLRPLAAGYRTWLTTQATRLAQDPEIARYADAAERALKDAKDMADRLDRAIKLLNENGVAREAFRFANQAMARQRVRSELVRERRNRPDDTVSALLHELEVPENRTWRPFQLAFVLLCLPGLTDPNHRDAHRGLDDGQAQLLFFPTGGGKTEAYLGLTAYTFAIRRLQGVVGVDAEARDGSDGVAVLMRYTLRLLTAQQFQRAAALVCACEVLRQERIDNGDTRWGTVPFRLGLWVGSKVTPNTYEDARTVVNNSNRDDESKVGGPLQLVACPWCGSALSRSRDMKAVEGARRILLHCSDPNGECQFTPRHSPREGIPVLTVDEEVYRLTPALVISTVDKFAQLPWKAATATLFGTVDSRCPRHGWQNPDFTGFCRSHHPAAGPTLPAVRAEPAMRLRPPDLIIQDELHLISDALGSMVGLYETVVDKLASRTVNGKTIRPVLVASTATVRRARSQVEQVFARDLAVFPTQVLDANETFFSTVTTPSPRTPGRRYRGIMAPGERLKAVEIRVGAALLEHAQYLFDRHGEAADPYMTLVDYFTSTRELAGMRRLVDDDISDRLASRQVRTRRRRPTVSELTSRMPSDRISTTLADLENRFDPAHDSTTAIQTFAQMARADRDKARELLAGRPRPLDVLLATSMLQVGVDVPRLGLMLVTGQPKNTAEYIQATSRVGRKPAKPGLIVTIYQWTRPRDLAHYETFCYDHATFGMRVEGLTTTPFSDRALDRGLTAVVVAALRQAGMASLPNVGAHDNAAVPLNGPVADALAGLLRSRAERVTHDNDTAAVTVAQAQHRLDRWQLRRKKLPTGSLGYREAADVTGLLRKPDEGTWDLWSAPMSLREVEPEILLQLDWTDRSLMDAPGWDYDRRPGSSS
ncbi:helicase [Actinomadura sp. NAK00032]|uniref:DISARM system helicase DrmA n=1 Tax=Actinomadura sp. NAK00032 TaxID=2742128 RepID=UPI0015907C04|nr:DISARM system helicase DrmA [Actinomadura sp. NAK00032]QKW39929.1 helicase [Actinomadura sp. NAK00032]